MPIPPLSLAAMHEDLRSEILAFLETFYDSNRYVLGENVERFEEEWARYCGTRHCIGVASGLDALILSMMALEIGPEDEVIVPSNTYIATWIAVSRVGATIVPVEPDPTTFNLDPHRIEKAVTPRTRAILPVHLFGRACAMDAINAVAARHGLAVVEDNAQAHGAGCGGRRTGALGTINGTSFYPTKNLGALGDAGAVTTDDSGLAERVRTLRNYGSSRKNHNDVIGINSRLDEVQAGILRIKLRHLDRWNDERRRIAGRYTDRLADVGDLVLPGESVDGGHVYHLYVIRTAHRDRLIDFLGDRDIGSAIHYPVPPHLQPAYSNLGFRRGDFPIAEALADSALSLPLYVGITEGEIDDVAAAVVDFMAGADGSSR
jgi:dTDP-4-amino-4,6-dideoxygalactose transaminase